MEFSWSNLSSFKLHFQKSTWDINCEKLDMSCKSFTHSIITIMSATIVQSKSRVRWKIFYFLHVDASTILWSYDENQTLNFIHANCKPPSNKRNVLYIYRYIKKCFSCIKIQTVAKKVLVSRCKWTNRQPPLSAANECCRFISISILKVDFVLHYTAAIFFYSLQLTWIEDIKSRILLLREQHEWCWNWDSDSQLKITSLKAKIWPIDLGFLIICIIAGLAGWKSENVICAFNLFQSSRLLLLVCILRVFLERR